MGSCRLMVTPGCFSEFGFPLRCSFQRLSPISHRVSACKAVVLPELFGPMKTTGFPNSTSISPKRLKLRQISFVSISSPPRANQPVQGKAMSHTPLAMRILLPQPFGYLREFVLAEYQLKDTFGFLKF